MRVLNLYPGVGGNRKLWGDEHDITAVEIVPEIAAIYADLFPNDTVIVGDAHQYLINNYEDYDFIWASPPCPTHSVTNHFLNAKGIKRYPDLKLYEEIILLQTFFKGRYVVENVKSYYTPLIPPQISGRHYFWANFRIPNLAHKKTIGRMNGARQNQLRRPALKRLNIDLSKYKYGDKEKLLRNCVPPEIGKAIFDMANNCYQATNLTQLEIEY